MYVKILYHAIEIKMASAINAGQTGSFWCSFIEYTTTFLHSGWLYFLGHGIKYDGTLILFAPMSGAFIWAAGMTD